jgi:hypothetical protein
MKVIRGKDDVTKLTEKEKRKLAILKLADNGKFVENVGIKDGDFYMLTEEQDDDNDQTPNNQTSLFPNDFRVIEFEEHEEELLTYFSNHEVSEIGFKEIFVLRKCRGEKYFSKAFKGLRDRANILYYGLSLEDVMNVAEHHREMGTYFRIVPTPCLTLECRKYKLSFFDKFYSALYADTKKNEKLKKLIDSINLTENRTYIRVITYLKNINIDLSTCFLIAPDITLNSCSNHPLNVEKQLTQFHYVSEVPNSDYKIEWVYTNIEGELFQPD